jgi:hypothetical protein
MRSITPTLSTTASRAAMNRQLLWAGGVMAIAMLSAYVYTVNESVSRGESQRQAQRIVDNDRMAHAHRGARVPDQPAGQYAYVNAP